MIIDELIEAYFKENKNLETITLQQKEIKQKASMVRKSLDDLLKDIYKLMKNGKSSYLYAERDGKGYIIFLEGSYDKVRIEEVDTVKDLKTRIAVNVLKGGKKVETNYSGNSYPDVNGEEEEEECDEEEEEPKWKVVVQSPKPKIKMTKSQMAKIIQAVDARNRNVPF